MYTLKCQQCGCEFEHYSTKRMFCDKCNYERDLERRREQYSKKRAKAKLNKQPAKPFKSIPQVIRELEDYNKKHGTRLTYGKYVEIMR